MSVRELWTGFTQRRKEKNLTARLAKETQRAQRRTLILCGLCICFAPLREPVFSVFPCWILFPPQMKVFGRGGALWQTFFPFLFSTRVRYAFNQPGRLLSIFCVPIQPPLSLTTDASQAQPGRVDITNRDPVKALRGDDDRFGQRNRGLKSPANGGFRVRAHQGAAGLFAGEPAAGIRAARWPEPNGQPSASGWNPSWTEASRFSSPWRGKNNPRRRETMLQPVHRVNPLSCLALGKYKWI